MSKTINLGQVAGIIISPNEPQNTTVLWGKQNDIENDPDDITHYYYNGVSWVTLSSRGIGEMYASGLILADTLDQLGDDGTNWVLADGQDVTGSTYHTISGNTTVPNLPGGAGVIYVIKIN